MILPFSHTPQNSTSTPNGVDDVAQPCSPFRASCTPWLTLSEHGWVSSHERRSVHADRAGRERKIRLRSDGAFGHSGHVRYLRTPFSSSTPRGVSKVGASDVG